MARGNNACGAAAFKCNSHFFAFGYNFVAFKKLHGQEWDINQTVNLRRRSLKRIAKGAVQFNLLILLAENLQSKLFKTGIINRKNPIFKTNQALLILRAKLQ